MISQTEIIVGAEQQRIMAVADDVRRLPAVDNSCFPQQAAVLYLFKFMLYRSAHGTPYCQPAYYTKVDNVSKKKDAPVGSVPNI